MNGILCRSIAAALLAALSPLLLIISIIIRVCIGRPVLFRQQRVGRNDSLFTLYKFRTMRDAADAFGLPLPDSERLIPLGRMLRKTSLDELPQLWNVVRGDMSLIGPRPLLPEYLPRYTPLQRRRHQVKPGITGWAQVNGRNALSWEQKFELDLWYVEHKGLRLDCRILWLTLLKVTSRDGISKDGHATMPEFRGSTPGV